MKYDVGCDRRWRLWSAVFALLIGCGGLLPIGCKSDGTGDELKIFCLFGDDEDALAAEGVAQVATLPFPVPLDLLEADEVATIVERAARAIDHPMLTIVVVDRVGHNLAAWRRNPSANPADDTIRLNKAAAIARAAAFLSSSQGPLTSRTLEYISTFHFPPTFGAPQLFGFPGSLCFETLPEQRRTTGITNTSQGPLWQIFASNRGARFQGNATLADGTVANTAYNLDADGVRRRVPSGTNIDGTVPHAGLGYLPGGIPIYEVRRVLFRSKGLFQEGCADFPSFRAQASKSVSGRLLGAIGCYIPDPTAQDVKAMEFAALVGAGPTAFVSPTDIGVPTIPPEGVIYLVGILLPYVDQSSAKPSEAVRPQGYGEGDFDAAAFVTLPDGSTTRESCPDAFGWLIGPRGDPRTDLPLAQKLTRLDVIEIITNGLRTANRTRAAIRLPLGTTTRMIMAVTNSDGLILGLFRMEDAPIFSTNVSISKARNVVYFSSPTVDRTFDFPVPQVPPGTAVTNRTLGFLAQPFFPPTIDGTGNAPLVDFLCGDINDPGRFRDGVGRPGGPLFHLAVRDQDPRLFEAAGLNGPGLRTPPAAPIPQIPFGEDDELDDDISLQSGLVFFPGASPLYKNGVLVGGFGVSGDGVEEDDFVTVGGITGFEAPENIRADNYLIDGVRLPYFKFPQIPGPGRSRR